MTPITESTIQPTPIAAPQPPRGGGDCTDDSPALHEGAEVWVDAQHAVNDLLWPANGDHGKHWDDEEGREHDEALNRVGVGCAEEAAEHRVGERDACDEQHTGQVAAVERGLEELTASGHTGGYVEGEEHQDHDAGDDAQDAGLIAEAVFEVARDGDGVVGDFGETAQAWRDEDPVECRTNGEADRHPRLEHTHHVEGTRQAHHEPAGHVRRASAECRGEWVQAAAAEHVVVAVVGFLEGVVADQEHRYEVDDDGDEFV